MDTTQRHATGMKIIEEGLKPRRNLGRGIRRGPKEYDGSGSSGYAGTAGGRKRPVQRQCVQLPISDVPCDLRDARGGRKSRRVRKTQWVALDKLRAHV